MHTQLTHLPSLCLSPSLSLSQVEGEAGSIDPVSGGIEQNFFDKKHTAADVSIITTSWE